MQPNLPSDDESLPALLVTLGNTPRKRRSLYQLTTTIGRARSCDIRLDSPEVSAFHCLISRSGNSLSIRDCESGSGTFLNNHPVREADLRDGDMLQIGPFIFRVAIPVEPPTHPKTLTVNAEAAIESDQTRQCLEAERAVLEARRVALERIRDDLERRREEFEAGLRELNVERENLKAQFAAAASAAPPPLPVVEPDLELDRRVRELEDGFRRRQEQADAEWQKLRAEASRKWEEERRELLDQAALERAELDRQRRQFEERIAELEQERDESARTMPVTRAPRLGANPDSTLKHDLNSETPADRARLDDPEHVDLDDLERMLRRRESALSGPRPTADSAALEQEEAELERLARQLADREAELESLRRELDSRENLLEDERRSVEQARADAAAKDELNERLQGELAARGARIDGEQEQIATLEAWLDAERRNAAALKAEVDAQRAELERLEQRLHEAPKPESSTVDESEVLLAGPERSISALELKGQLADREEVVRELSARLEQALERINELEAGAAHGAPPSLDMAAIKAEAIRQSRQSFEQHGRDVLAVELESLRARLDEGREQIERMDRDLAEARDAGRQTARELEEARQQNRQMTREAANQFTRLQQEELALRDRIRELENRHDDPAERAQVQQLQQRIAELEHRLERNAGAARPPLPQEIADYERQLEEYRANLENAQRDLDQRQKEFDDRCRNHELQLSKDRAEIARDRGTLERLRHEFRQEVERAERDPQLFEKLMSLNRVTQEIRAKATHAREEQTTLTSRIREFMRKFGDG